MATWGLEGGLSVLLFLALAPLLVAPFLAWVYRRYRYPAPGPTALAVASGLYACALFAFTTFPLPSAPETFCVERSRIDYWQLAPGASLADVLDRYREVGVAGTLTSGVFLQVAFNVAFFVPLGFLVAYWLRRGIGTALVAGLGTSLLIEVTQGSGLWGLYPCPYRLADVDDLAANTLGALVGWGIGVGATRLVPFREPARRLDLDVPTLRRRLLAAVLDLTLVVVVAFGVDLVLVFVAAVRDLDGPAVQTWSVVVQYLVGVALLLVVPAVRRDRATPGQLTVLLAPASRGEPPAPAPRWSVLVRFVVRWLPILVWGTPAIIAVAAAELASVARRDRTSLVGRLARTVTVTHDRLAASATQSAPSEPVLAPSESPHEP